MKLKMMGNCRSKSVTQFAFISLKAIGGMEK